MTRIALLLVRGYRTLVSPLLRPRCKYHPTCSRYAADALHEYGLVRGLVLAAWRVARCNPWSHGGVDYAHDQSLFHRHSERAA